MKYTVRVGDAFQEAEVLETQQGAYRITLAGQLYQVDLRQIGPRSLYSILVDGQSHEFYVVGGMAPLDILIEGQLFAIRILPHGVTASSFSQGEGESAGAELRVEAPIPGVISEVYVQSNQAVERGEHLLVLEAMKMQNELRAPRAGVVKEVLVARGQRVNKGDVLVVLTGEASAEAQSKSTT